MAFRQQLWTAVNCNNIPLSAIGLLKYQKTPLLNYFRNFNKCVGDTSEEYRVKKKRDFLNLKITPGINYSTINIDVGTRDIDKWDFGSQVGLRLGLDVEWVVPINRNKWRIVIEPAFQYFKSDTLFKFPHQRVLNYKSVEFPIGLRYYSYLSKDIKLFYNAFFISSVSFNFNTIIKGDFGGDYVVKPSNSFAGGIGGEWRIFSLEARYYSNRSLFYDLYTKNSKYDRFALVFGIKIF